MNMTVSEEAGDPIVSAQCRKDYELAFRNLSLPRAQIAAGREVLL